MADSMYSSDIKNVDGFEVYSLTQNGKAMAEVVPSLGNNCYVYKVSYRENWFDIIDPPPDLSTLEKRPTAFGNPILFPFPNRIRNGRWEFEGKTYQFDNTPDSPTTIHGLLLNRAYKVERHLSDEDAATLVCSLKSVDFPDVIRQYPFPFKIEITYTIQDSVLSMLTKITNTGKDKMPMGYGIHPYFNVNISGTGRPEDALITVPANKYWELDEVLVPTGKVLDVEGNLDLRNGQPFGKLKLDHVFTDVLLADDVSRCTIVNQETGFGLMMESDAQFRELVVYTPPDRDAICFEPYTCPTDAINLETKGIPAGVIVLSPGESFSATVRFLATYTPQK